MICSSVDLEALVLESHCRGMLIRGFGGTSLGVALYRIAVFGYLNFLKFLVLPVS